MRKKQFHLNIAKNQILQLLADHTHHKKFINQQINQSISINNNIT